VTDKLVDKTAVEDIAPPQIAYTATKKGEELLKIIDELYQWGINW
jgi:DNA-binding HxlR family transcriptional regulator